MRSKICCDNCGHYPDPEHLVVDDNGKFIRHDELMLVYELPKNINSANKGESAYLCYECHEMVYTTP